MRFVAVQRSYMHYFIYHHWIIVLLGLRIASARACYSSVALNWRWCSLAYHIVLIFVYWWGSSCLSKERELCFKLLIALLAWLNLVTPIFLCVIINILTWKLGVPLHSPNRRWEFQNHFCQFFTMFGLQLNPVGWIDFGVELGFG